MSFWSGVVQGVKDIDVLKEKEALADERQGVRDEENAYRDQMRIYNEKRDGIADARNRVADDRVERLDARDVERYNTSEEQKAEERSRTKRLDAQELARYNTSEEQKAEALSVQRGLDILKLGGGAFGSALKGGGGDVNSGNVISTGGMKAGVMGMTAELEAAGGMDNLDATSKEWFKSVLGNPQAAAGILAFAHAQREEGNDLSITELPKIIQLAGTMEAAGEDAYLDFKERFAAGNVDMKNPEQFLAGMQALMQYKPAQVVWGQVQAVDSPATKKMDFETWQTNTTTWANVAAANMPDGTEKDDLLNTLANVSKTGSEHELTRGKAFVSLWEKYGRQAAEELGLDKTNPHMRPYFAIMSNNDPSGTPPEEPLVPGPAPEVPVVPDVSGTPPVGAPVEPQATPTPAPLSFDTVEEAEAAVDAMTPEAWAQVPFIVIAGAEHPNKRYVGPPSIGDPNLSQPPGGLDLEQTQTPSEALQTTVSTGDTRPTNQGIGDLSKPSVLDSVTSAYVTAKGEPLSQEEELSIGIEAIVDGLIGDTTDQAELDSLIIELQEKFGDEKVREALTLAMNLQQ